MRVSRSLRRASALVAVVALTAALVACGGGDDDAPAAGSAGSTVDVVAGFYPLAWVAERVGGDRVRVRDLTPPGVEPHDLELSPDEVDALEDADVALVIGGGFQPALEKAADRRSGLTVDVLTVVAGDGADPHVWLDPVGMQDIVTSVRDALADTDPAQKDRYTARADAVLEELRSLDADYRSGLSDCDRRTIVTAHEAFGRLAARYELRQQSIAGLSPDQEPDPARLADLADLVEEEGVTTIFTEELLPRALAETLARETGATVAVLSPVETLTEEQRTAGDDYVGVMRANLATLRAALGCR